MKDVKLSELREMYRAAHRGANFGATYGYADVGVTGTHFAIPEPRWIFVEVGSSGSGSMGGQPAFFHQWSPLQSLPLYDLDDIDGTESVDDFFDYIEGGDTFALDKFPLIEVNGQTVASGTRVWAWFSDTDDCLLFEHKTGGTGAVKIAGGYLSTAESDAYKIKLDPSYLYWTEGPTFDEWNIWCVTASGSTGGVLTTGAQSIAGRKTIANGVTVGVTETNAIISGQCKIYTPSIGTLWYITASDTLTGTLRVGPGTLQFFDNSTSPTHPTFEFSTISSPYGGLHLSSGSAGQVAITIDGNGGVTTTAGGFSFRGGICIGAAGPFGGVSGPGSSTDGTIALFDGTDGETLKEATGTGGVEVTSGVFGTYTLTSYAKNLLDDATDADARTTLGLGDLAVEDEITTAEIAAATLVTEAEGIPANDNDTTLPTSAAVKDYADSYALRGTQPGGRLTLATGTPFTVSDLTGISTLRYTPDRSDYVRLYDGTRVREYAFTERSLALSGLTSGALYDVFLYDSSGTLTLGRLAWASDSARATALAWQTGLGWVLSGSPEYLWLGTFRATSTTTTESSRRRRFVWNAYNQLPHDLFICPGYNDNNSGNSYTYNSTTWIEANAGTDARVEWVQGSPGEVKIGAVGFLEPGFGNFGALGIGVDSVTTPKGVGYTPASIGAPVTIVYAEPVAAGYHYAAQLLAGVFAGNITVYTDDPRRGGSADPYVTYLSGSILA